MYGDTPAKLAEKMPYHIEEASAMLNRLTEMNHRDQIEAFNHIRNGLIERRKMQAECIAKENEERAFELNTHIEGTKAIASAL